MYHEQELRLDQNQFMALVAGEKEDLPAHCREFLQQQDFRYQRLEGGERDAAILATLNTIGSARSDSSGKHRLAKWEAGWSDNLKSLQESGGDLAALTPGYIKPGKVLRLDQEYIRTADDDFLINFYTAYRQFLFDKYLKGSREIFEFGCGTGINLVLMARLFPEARLHGLDWTAASVEILKNIVATHGYHITPRRFDMFDPDETLEFPPGSAVITLNSMEQLGGDHEAFLQFLIRKGPALCINSEPIYELYEEDNLIDNLAMRYHEKRNYLKGLLPRLQKFEADGAIEIIKTKRVPFGIQFHEGYSYVVWRPVRKG